MRPKNWWIDGGLLVGFGVWTLLLVLKTPLLGMDLAVRDWAESHWPPGAHGTARVINYVGQGGQVLTPLAVLMAAFFVWRRRSVRPLLPVAGAFILTYLTIGPLKVLTQRAAADDKTIAHPEWLFHDPGALSYPSGHVVNSIIWYGVYAILLGPLVTGFWRGLVRFGAPLIVLCTTTYLTWHWVTDGIGAIMVGLFLDRLMRRVPWDHIPLGNRPWTGPAQLEPDDLTPSATARRASPG